MTEIAQLSTWADTHDAEAPKTATEESGDSVLKAQTGSLSAASLGY